MFLIIAIRPVICYFFQSCINRRINVDSHWCIGTYYLIMLFLRLQARFFLMLNRFACVWPKDYQRGSLGKSHQNGDYLKQAMQKKIMLPQGSNLQPLVPTKSFTCINFFKIIFTVENKRAHKSNNHRAIGNLNFNQTGYINNMKEKCLILESSQYTRSSSYTLVIYIQSQHNSDRKSEIKKYYKIFRIAAF